METLTSLSKTAIKFQKLCLIFNATKYHLYTKICCYPHV